MASSSSSSLSSSSSSVVPRRKGGWTYDVFLSFRGEDTRNNFVDHLYAALVQKGIRVFKDDEMLGVGQPISEDLMKAIKESRFAVVVFSNNYADSSWCLEELSKIMECHKQMGQRVLPVFYHVDPSDIRGQKGEFATAFKKHEDKFRGEMDKVKNWRDALTAAANLSGHHILPHNMGESAFINKIVQQILADKQPRGGIRGNHLIGIESRIDALYSLLNIEATEEVRIVGMWGMGGIGKTTIARALVKKIAYKFEGSSFVSSVRENISSKKDICGLQEKILNDILGSRPGFKIQDPEDGAEMIEERLCCKKVLLVLDDVDDDKQLEFLAATPEWFGLGSRIIITTRDQHLLSYANDKYRPALLRLDHAVELFSRHAFLENSPPEGYEELSIRAIRYTGGLPLALKVLGSFFHGRPSNVWESALDRLVKIPNKEIYDMLKLSFNHLDVSEQKIFLDIACFYKGKDVKDVTAILDSFGFDPVIGISVLTEKCLITVSNDKLDMHDLIQEMGWKVVQETAPNSRLWQLEKIHDFIKDNNRELEVIEGIVVPLEKNVELSGDVFENMKNLRVFDVHSNFTSSEPSFFPDELRWFCWLYYPFSSVPVAHMRKLAGLRLMHGRIEHLWQGKKMMQNLKFINLAWCGHLKSFPDVSGAPNIESLDLYGCQNLVDVDESLGSLKKLVYLDMSFCHKLKCLPFMLELESLKTLKLCVCVSFERLPEFSPCMVNLSHIDVLLCNKIQELSSSIKYLVNLGYLNLESCTSLKNIPDSICELKCLNTLSLLSCKELQKLPDNFQSTENLQELHINSIHFPTLTNFYSLRKLYLHGEIGDDDFPKNLHGLSSLEELHINNNSELIQVPPSISHLSSLKRIEFMSCRRLQTLHGLPSGIQVLIASYCESLEKIEDLSKENECLNKIWIYNCPKLLDDEENDRYLDKMLEQSFLEKRAAVDSCVSINIPRSNIPSWFKEQKDGCQITLKLLPKWQTEIMGFAVCCVSRGPGSYPEIKLRFENDGMFFPKSSEADIISESVEVINGNIWIGYIPFSLFERLLEGEDNDFKDEDCFHMNEGNLVVDMLMTGNDLKCGAHVVYREDVASIQQNIPSISSSYWSWTLKNELASYIMCRPG